MLPASTPGWRRGMGGSRGTSRALGHHNGFAGMGGIDQARKVGFGLMHVHRAKWFVHRVHRWLETAAINLISLVRRRTKQGVCRMASLGRVKVDFYPGGAMGMNIKDPEVHAMARELARSPSPELARSVEAKKAAVRAICARFSARPEWQGRTSRELQDALYDDQGLPK